MGENSWYWGWFKGERRKYYGALMFFNSVLWLGMWAVTGFHWPHYNPVLGVVALIIGTITMTIFYRQYGRWW